MCGVAATKVHRIEGRDALGTTAAMVSPVSVQRVHSLDVPVCNDHDDGIALFVNGSELSLGFRSRAYHLEFQRLNG